MTTEPEETTPIFDTLTEEVIDSTADERLNIGEERNLSSIHVPAVHQELIRKVSYFTGLYNGGVVASAIFLDGVSSGDAVDGISELETVAEMLTDITLDLTNLRARLEALRNVP